MSEKIREIFMEILKIDDLKSNSSLNKTENWDSLNHLIIMSRLENEFNVKFTAKDIERLKFLLLMVYSLPKSSFSLL